MAHQPHSRARRRAAISGAVLLRAAMAAIAQEPDPGAAAPDVRTTFRVKYVAQGVLYLDGGSSAGLSIGMTLFIRDGGPPDLPGATVDPSDPRIVARLTISGVAEVSAVADVPSTSRALAVGDVAILSTLDARALVEQRTLSPSRRYPAVVTFTEGDPLDEEVRDEVPRPPLPSVNRFRMRLGLDVGSTSEHGDAGSSASTFGIVMRPDLTRIGGSYWNLSGYFRGREGSGSSTGSQTLQDIVNRTYHIGLTYDNPNARWVAGIGRIYLPWAPSLDTIDGGYGGRRFGRGGTVGVFAGTTPDPTSWSYAPDRRIAGGFVNLEGGSYEGFRYTTTSGLGVSTLGWTVDRPFVFFENGLFFKSVLSIYDSLQIDGARGQDPSAGAGLSRHFLTVRLQPVPRLELSLQHNYFRDLPAFDPKLVGTGLLDRYLFQGINLGARVEAVRGVWIYGAVGQSDRTGDARTSWNQTYGVTWARVPWLGARADAHWARFNSSLGDGSYASLSLSRSMTEALRVEVLAGVQSFSSPLATADRAAFVTANLDVVLGTHYFLQGGYTMSRGQFSYDQWMASVGYIFDTRRSSR